MTMNSHALLSASSSHRWLKCTKSALLESVIADTSTQSANEGTLAHEVCCFKLHAMLRLPCKPVATCDKAMNDYADDYVAFVMEQKAQMGNPEVLIEHRVDFSDYVPDGFGTADCILVDKNTLHIVDFKYGIGVLVSAKENSQMRLYALGALKLFPNAEQIKMTIFQPRRQHIETETLTKPELLAWGEEIKPLAQKAFKGEGEFVCDEETCRFCRANVKCKARADEQLKLARYKFQEPYLLQDNDIEAILSQADDLISWANAIKQYALDEAIKGKKWNGYELGQGRTNRKYTSEEQVAKALETNGITDIYETKLLGITAMERKLGKEKFQILLGEFVEKPQGKPILVPTNKKGAKFICQLI